MAASKKQEKGNKVARKKTPVKRSRKKAQHAKKRRWFGLFVKLSLVMLAVLVIYGIYLDGRIRERFDGQKWQLPAQVYGRPLELYAGQQLSIPQMERELKLLNYRKVKTPGRPGEYSASAERVNIYKRGFHFPDGFDITQPLQLDFKRSELVSIANRDTGARIGYIRLDPVLLARITFGEIQDRLFVRLKDMPPLLINTLITVEDRNFYHHGGISIEAVGRALLANLRAGRTVQGGSTLTQQVVKNFFLTRERSLWRKMNEAYMALLIEHRYSKDEILESYLNEVYLGQNFSSGVYGFGLASYFYFGRPINELPAQQIALLVGMVKGPSYYDPWRNPKQAKARRDLVLRLMTQRGLLNADQYRWAVSRPLGVIERGDMAFSKTPAFIELVKSELSSVLGKQFKASSGLKVFTSLDPIAQHSAERAVSERLRQLERSRNLKGLQSAMVVSDWRRAEVTAVVGGRDPHYAGFNRALDARRPIGSLIKPIAYATALANGYQLSSLLEDKPLALKNTNGTVWKPRNYDRKYRGQVLLYQALAESLNVPTIRLGMAVGVDKLITTLHQLGVKDKISPYPSLLLGSLSLSPLEVNQLYQPLLTGGLYQPFSALREITDAKGSVIWQRSDVAQPVFGNDVSFLTRYNLTRVTAEGTGRALKWTFPGVTLAGKTGTSDDLRDSWFAGADNRELVSVWVGHDDNQSSQLTGASGAMQLFAGYFKNRGVKSLELNPPESIEWAKFSRMTGAHVMDSCAKAVRLPIRKDKLAPALGCDGQHSPSLWQKVFGG